MAEFNMYMTKAQRADNSKMAHMAGDRFDGYGEDVESHGPVEYEGFSDFMPGRQYTVPMRSAGRWTAPTNSRVGPTQGQVFRQNPDPSPSRRRYPDASYAAGRGYVPYRPSTTYMEEEDEMFHKITFGGQPKPFISREMIVVTAAHK